MGKQPPLAVTPRSPPGPGGVLHPRPTAPDPPARRPTPSPARGNPGTPRPHSPRRWPSGRQARWRATEPALLPHIHPAPGGRARSEAEGGAGARRPGPRACERLVGPATGARSGAVRAPGAPPPAPRRPRRPAPPFGPARPCRPQRRCLRVTMSRQRWRPVGAGRASADDLRARAAHAPCGRRAWRAGARGHADPGIGSPPCEGADLGQLSRRFF